MLHFTVCSQKNKMDEIRYMGKSDICFKTWNPGKALVINQWSPGYEVHPINLQVPNFVTCITTVMEDFASISSCGI